jgi:hypothetical protein
VALVAWRAGNASTSAAAARLRRNLRARSSCNLRRMSSGSTGTQRSTSGMGGKAGQGGSAEAPLAAALGVWSGSPVRKPASADTAIDCARDALAWARAAFPIAATSAASDCALATACVASSAAAFASTAARRAPACNEGGHQWQSVAISSNQWYSVAISDASRAARRRTCRVAGCGGQCRSLERHFGAVRRRGRRVSCRHRLRARQPDRCLHIHVGRRSDAGERPAWRCDQKSREGKVALLPLPVLALEPLVLTNPLAHALLAHPALDLVLEIGVPGQSDAVAPW